MTERNSQKNPFNIKIIGIGDSGCQTVNFISKSKLANIDFISNGLSTPYPNNGDVIIDFICADIDTGTLKEYEGRRFIRLRKALQDQLSEENSVETQETLKDCDLLILITNTAYIDIKIATLVAQSAHKTKPYLSLVIINEPHSDTNYTKVLSAKPNIRKLTDYVDSIICVSTNNITTTNNKNEDTSNAQNQNVLHTVQSLIDPLIREGLVAIDLVDIKSALIEGKVCRASFGHELGQGRGQRAVNSAIKKAHINSAPKIFISSTSSPDTSMAEAFTDIADIIEEVASDDALIVMGATYDHDMNDEMRVTIITTGNYIYCLA